MHIKQQSSHYAVRSVGDCKRAKGHRARSMYFDSRTEAEELVSFFENHFEFCASPRIVFKTRQTKRRSAKVSLITGLITVFPKGRKVSTIIHELAHLEGVSGHRNHGRDFKQAQDKLLRFFDLYWDKEKN